MALREYVTSIGTTATSINGTQFPTWIIKNMGDATVYLGDGAVTTSNGWPLEPGDIFSPSELAHKSMQGKLGERWSGIVAADTEEVRVLIQGAVAG